jgi:DNA-binding transcriptional LysR family regulator
VALEELGAQTLILRQRNSQTRVWLEGVLQQHDLHPRVGAEFDNVESIKRAVINGQSVTVLPGYAVEHEVEMGRLWRLHAAGRPLQRTLKVLWNREAYASPVLHAVLRCLQRYLPTLQVEAIMGLAR